MNDLIPNAAHDGAVLLDGKSIHDRHLDPVDLRRRVGMVFQKSNPFPKSIYENITYGLRIQGVKNKARLERYEQLLAQEYDAREDAADIQIPSGPPLGDLVVRADKVSKAYGDRLLFENMTFNLPRGGIVGVIGPNGAGKTTLFRMIMGQEKADTGTLRVGDSVMLSYVDQSRDALAAPSPNARAPRTRPKEDRHDAGIDSRRGMNRRRTVHREHESNTNPGT